jgi:hypothetical protein
MQRLFLATALCVSACAAPKGATPCSNAAASSPQATRAGAPPLASPAARPTDVASLDSILAALYGGVSGPPGPRDWDRVRSLFAPGGWVAPVEKQEGVATARIMSLEDFIARASRNTSNDGFYEKEIARRTEAFGHIVHVFSTYEARHDERDPSPFRRGINSIQLLKGGDRYWVVSIYWDVERDGAPIPPEYLPPPR